jgi:hypothetical protein
MRLGLNRPYEKLSEKELKELQSNSNILMFGRKNSLKN